MKTKNWSLMMDNILLYYLHEVVGICTVNDYYVSSSIILFQLLLPAN